MKDNNELQTINHQITPMDLLKSAQEQGGNIEQMQKLMELQFQWEANQAQKAYNEAMAAFRAECPTLLKTKRGHNCKYAGLAESIEQIKPLLTKYGFSHHWKTDQKNDQVTVTCVVTHRLGHSEETSLTAAPDGSGSKNSIQAIGSTVTYLERYTLKALLGLAEQEFDDDGKGTSSTPEPTITEAQLADLEALMEEVKADEKGFLTWLKVNDLCQLPAKNYEIAIKALEAKRGK